ncbi:MAG: septum site-determining protein MinD [Clostridia bacterium]|nr:septum site-determining protein MinD [Clostridia bacterium]
MSQVIVITSGKGGVGKTTTTANLGVGLAKLGKKVVLIDTDIGLRNLDVVLGLENRIVYDLVDVVTGVCTPKQAAIKDKRFDGLFLIPAAQTKDKDAVTVDQMKELCEKLKKTYDFIIIDCPAGIEQGFKNAIAGADKALIVTTPEVSAVRDADRIIGLLEANEIEEHYLIINRIRPDMVRRGDMMNVDDIIDILNIDLIGIVPDDQNIIISTNKGEPAVVNPKSLAGQGYRNITERLNGNNVPLMDLDGNTFLGKIKKLFSKKQ